jgi:hypothetical protein
VGKMMEIGKFKAKDYWILAIPLFILNCLDMHSTMLNISQVGLDGEGNPIGRYVLENWNISFVIFLKIIFFPLILVWVSLFLNKSLKKMKYFYQRKNYLFMKKCVDSIMLILIFSLTVVVINNYSLIFNFNIGVFGQLYVMMIGLYILLVNFS